MSTTYKRAAHYAAELEMLGRAARGDQKAIHTVIQYLSSANPYLRTIVRAALHECVDESVWCDLVHCFGEHRWGQDVHDERLDDADTAQRLDEMITQIFLEDQNFEEAGLKTSILHQSLKDDSRYVRQAAAYLLGMRGEIDALLVLAEIIDQGELIWQLRAVQALASLNIPDSGPLLVQALGMGRGELHQAAGRALRKLTLISQSALLDALEHPDSHIRWHAARKLLEIGERRGVEEVVKGLFDEKRSIRIASAEALATMGADAVPLLLDVLSRPHLSQPTLQAIGHAIGSIRSYSVREKLRPLLRALQDPTSSSVVPSIAYQMLAEHS